MIQLIDLKEGAGELKVCIHTLRNWVNERRLPCVRFGRKILLRRKDVEDFVEKNLVEPK